MFPKESWRLDDGETYSENEGKPEVVTRVPFVAALGEHILVGDAAADLMAESEHNIITVHFVRPENLLQFMQRSDSVHGYFLLLAWAGLDTRHSSLLNSPC